VPLVLLKKLKKKTRRETGGKIVKEIFDKYRDRGIV